MKFLKDNVFLVSLVAAVVVLGGLLVFFQILQAKDVDAAIQQRTQVSSQLQQLAQPPLVNDEVVNSTRSHNEAMASAAKKTTTLCLDWNKAGFTVLQLPVEGKKKPAWPYNAEEYRKNSLDYVYTQRYVEELPNLLSKLSAAKAPSEKDIQNEAQQWLRKKEAEDRKKAAETGVSPTPTPEPIRNAAPAEDEGYRRPRMAAPGATPGSSGETTGGTGGPALSPEALAEGLKVARIKSAREGRIYVAVEDLDRVFTEPRTSVAPEELWAAQVNLWVQSEILSAVASTNDHLFRDESIKPNVVNSAVKRLVNIAVDRQYYKAGASGTSAVPVAASPGGAPAVEIGAAGDLTQHYTCPQFDVVRYSFTVVMPVRYLLDLEQNLLKRNYHTVLRVDIQDVPDDPESKYFYGSAPVKLVTIQGELLLLTDWERPLMPEQSLVQLGSAALRPEDLERVQKAGLNPNEAGAVGGGGEGAPAMPSGGRRGRNME